MLTQWAFDPDGTPFFWMSGMAGTGKSTIAQSICNRLDADKMLAASFFCSRSVGGNRSDARKIVPTIAFQLAHCIEGFKSQVCDVLQKPDRTNQPIDKQLRQLLWEPLDSAFITARGSLSGGIPLIVVVDGLDECPDAGAEECVRSLLRRFEHDLPVHLRFLLCSRSETHIGTPIRATTVNVSRFQLQDILRSDVMSDIRTHVEAGLAQMSSKREWGSEWYDQDDINFIVLQADVLFLYAATVLKYLEASKFRPEKRLQILRQLTFTAKTGKTGPLRSLHLLYRVILENLGDADDLEAFEVDLVRSILFILSFSPTPLPIPTIADLVGFNLSEVRDCIASLSSVVLIPPESEEKTEPVKALHASFPEFVRSCSSSPLFPTHFRFNVGEYHGLFFVRCLDILNESLQEGLLGKNAPRETKVDDASRDIINTCIPPDLRYASEYWITHARNADLDKVKDTMSEPIGKFVDEHLLHWLECLYWIKAESVIKRLRLDNSQDWLRVSKLFAFVYRCSLTSNDLQYLSPEQQNALTDISLIFEVAAETSPLKPYEIYHTPLVWLPTSASESLSRKQKQLYLPTIERGRFKSWLDLGNLGNYGDDRYRTIPRDLQTISGSLFTSSRLSCARWLSYSDNSELVLHEWDTRTSSETRTIIQHIDSRNRDDRIHKIAGNGVFSFDRRENVLYFQSPSLYTEPQAFTLDCLHGNGGLGRTVMAVSQRGDYVVVWQVSVLEVCLVDVRNSARRLLQLRESEAEYFCSPFTARFSPDETLLGISYSIG